jgi:hypothetical protein
MRECRTGVSEVNHATVRLRFTSVSRGSLRYCEIPGGAGCTYFECRISRRSYIVETRNENSLSHDVPHQCRTYSLTWAPLRSPHVRQDARHGSDEAIG